jgi:hypothetical protein
MERKAPNWCDGKELTVLKSGVLPQPYLAGGNTKGRTLIQAPAALPSGRMRSTGARGLSVHRLDVRCGKNRGTNWRTC